MRNLTRTDKLILKKKEGLAWLGFAASLSQSA